MAIYYVRKGGNDGTGDGSTGNPWLTVAKALTVVASGDTVNIGDGTYAENNGGFLNLNRAFVSYVTFQAENLAQGAVTITNTSGTIPTIVNASAAYMRFKYITFTAIAGSNSALRINNACDHFDFQNCTFTPVDSAAATLYCADASTWNVSNLAFSNCVFNRPSSGAAHVGLQLSFTSSGICQGATFTGCNIYGISSAVNLANADNVSLVSCTIDSTNDYGVVATSSPDLVAITDCTISAAKHAIYANGATNWTITRGNFSTSGAFSTILLGLDSYTGGVATTGCTLLNMTVTHPVGLAGHAVILGNGCNNCTVDGLKVTQCQDYALVIKENTNITVQNCNLFAGTASALYFKATVGSIARYNMIYAAAGAAFQMLKGDTGNKNQNWTFQYNRVYALGAGSCYKIGSAADDLGGGVVNNNVLRVSSGVIGNVRGTNNITSLSALRAAWSGYGAGTNDNLTRKWIENPSFFFPDGVETPVAYRLIDATLDLARALSVVHDGITTSDAGANANLIDNLVTEPDDWYNGGTVWILEQDLQQTDIAVIIPETAAAITDYSAASGTFTMSPSPIMLLPAGVYYYAAGPKFPYPMLKQCINQALREVGRAPMEASFVATGAESYSGDDCQAIDRKIVRVYEATRPASPDAWTVHQRWAQIPYGLEGARQLVFDERSNPASGNTVKILYVDQHAPLVDDLDEINAQIDRDVIIWTAAVYALSWRMGATRGDEPETKARFEQAQQMRAMMQAKYRQPLPLAPNLGRW